MPKRTSVLRFCSKVVSNKRPYINVILNEDGSFSELSNPLHVGSDRCFRFWLVHYNRKCKLLKKSKYTNGQKDTKEDLYRIMMSVTICPRCFSTIWAQKQKNIWKYFFSEKNLCLINDRKVSVWCPRENFCKRIKDMFTKFMSLMLLFVNL